MTTDWLILIIQDLQHASLDNATWNIQGDKLILQKDRPEISATEIFSLQFFHPENSDLEFLQTFDILPPAEPSLKFSIDCKNLFNIVKDAQKEMQISHNRIKYGNVELHFNAHFEGEDDRSYIVPTRELKNCLQMIPANDTVFLYFKGDLIVECQNILLFFKI